MLDSSDASLDGAEQPQSLSAPGEQPVNTFEIDLNGFRPRESRGGSLSGVHANPMHVQVHEPVRPSIRNLRWYEWMPVVNSIYELLFHEPPTVEVLEKTLHLLALVDALLFCVIIAIPCSISYDELTALNERFREEGGYRDYFISGLPANDDFGTYDGYYSSRLNAYLADALNSVAISFVSVIGTYIFAMNSVAGGSELVEENEILAWWKYSRFTLLIQAVFTLAGFYFTICSVYILIECKFPDPYIEQYGEYSSYLGVRKDNPWGYNNTTFLVSMNVSMLITIALVSIATTNRLFTRHNPNVVPTILGFGCFLPGESRD
ncbi:hypothetical protein CYMTET_55935 [Cymbomonas tetramitiformis]|uniref:Transmembrane protein n=1 Tax=Cymbomonas tetramitiformis TaxID=36881 RepID=A0AAE0BDE9_9CHLO|nr:hypothetical protein CYMTET_55935 [Cymbomonas tetramitiformis]|eukprot:gene7363-8760_t